MHTRSLLNACVAMLLVLGIVAGNLWRELRSERAHVADLQQQLAQWQAAAAALQAPVPAPPVVTASVPNAAAAGAAEDGRADALAQSAGKAAARVADWSARLADTAQALTPQQLQALNDAAIEELARETEDSLAIGNRAAPMDALARARLDEATVTRQHETHLRILGRMTPHLTAEQSNALRSLFESRANPRLAAARAEVEKFATSRR